MAELNKNIPIPLYYQLKELIRSNIQLGLWKPGDTVPPERELSERFGVSRMTTRQAISELVSEGLLYRQQGKGTFVSRPKIEKKSNYLTSFSTDMIERGMRPGSQVVLFAIETVPSEILSDLPDASLDVYHLHRIRYADGSPMAIEHVYLPKNRFPGLDAFNFEECSLYHVLQSHFDIDILYANQTIRVKRFTPDEAKVFGFKSGSGLLTARKVYDKSNTLVEYARSLYHPDRYEYVSTLYPKGDDVAPYR